MGHPTPDPALQVCGGAHLDTWLRAGHEDERGSLGGPGRAGTLWRGRLAPSAFLHSSFFIKCMVGWLASLLSALSPPALYEVARVCAVTPRGRCNPILQTGQPRFFSVR